MENGIRLEMDLMKPYIPLGGLCVDVGANIGTHTLFFAKCVGPEGVVFSFEPERTLFQLFCANVALNDHLNVLTFNTALDKAPGSARLPAVDFREFGNFGSFRLQQEGGYNVAVQTLDNYLFPFLDLIKIDVEGNEPEVVLGSSKTIAKHRPFIYSEYHPKMHSQDLLKLLTSLDYVIYGHNACAYNPQNFKKNPLDLFGSYLESNIFCVPKEKKLEVHLAKFN